MKKILMAVAIVCAAVCAHAATVNWTIGYIEGAGAGGNGWSGTALSGADITAQIFVSATADFATTVVFDTDTVTGAEDGYMFGSSVGTMVADTDYYAKVVITAGNSKLESNVYPIQAYSFAETTAEPVFAFASEAGNVGGALDATYGTFNSAGWQAVPEPTSGLLMLVGLAGLALRRKRA